MTKHISKRAAPKRVTADSERFIFANSLAQKLTKFWRKRGYETARFFVLPDFGADDYVVRSNLVGGLPPTAQR